MKFDFSFADLNAMSEDQKKTFLTGEFSTWKMQQAARFAAPFWWVAPLRNEQGGNVGIPSGKMLES